MKKTILTFGLISGAVSAVMMCLTVPFADRIGFDRSEYVGYTSIILSFLLVFFGIRSFRDNLQGGQITFGKGFLIGLGITFISCLCYVAAWEVLSHTILTGHLDKYWAYMSEKAKSSGAGDAVVQQKLQELEKMKQWYANPLVNVAMTFLEPFPVGLVITLISAGVLRKQAARQSEAGVA